MIKQFVVWGVAAVLLFFTVRRWLFLLVALLPAKPTNRFTAEDLPAVLLLVPVRNEADALPELFWALERLNYPGQKLTVVFVSDGSSDSSEQLIQARVANTANWRLLSLPQNVGKAAALNLALKQFTGGQIIAIYDVDERPLPTTLFELVQPFSNPYVGAVTGRRAVSNSLSSPAASYTTFEGLVHQLVTGRAKDRLNLAPPILGSNCAYRRVALVEAGNFRVGALLEDSDLTLKLTQAGWQIRFVPEAISYHRVPQSIAGYWRQHTRWARGFNEVVREQAGLVWRNRQLSLPLRFELLTFSLGYLDRLALLVGLGLSLFKSRVATGAVIISLLTPLLQVVTALSLAKASVTLWLRLMWLPFFFGLDVAMATVGAWRAVRRAPQIWEERVMRR